MIVVLNFVQVSTDVGIMKSLIVWKKQFEWKERIKDEDKRVVK